MRTPTLSRHRSSTNFESMRRGASGDGTIFQWHARAGFEQLKGLQLSREIARLHVKISQAVL
jgi:hypothetical protein